MCVCVCVCAEREEQGRCWILGQTMAMLLLVYLQLMQGCKACMHLLAYFARSQDSYILLLR